MTKYEVWITDCDSNVIYDCVLEYPTFWLALESALVNLRALENAEGITIQPHVEKVEP